MFMSWIGIGAYLNDVSTQVSSTFVNGCNWDIIGVNYTGLHTAYNFTNDDGNADEEVAPKYVVSGFGIKTPKVMFLNIEYWTYYRLSFY